MAGTQGCPSHVKLQAPHVANALGPGLPPHQAGSPYLIAVPLRLQVCLEPAQQRDPVAGLPLQRPVAVKPLHELALPLDG